MKPIAIRATFTISLLAALACQQPRGAPGRPIAIDSAASAQAGDPVNDETYFTVLEYFKQSVAAGLEGDSILKHQNFLWATITALKSPVTKSNATYDRVRLMEGLITLCDDEGYENTWRRLRSQLRSLQAGPIRPNVALNPTALDHAGLERLARIADELPTRGQPATPLPPVAVSEVPAPPAEPQPVAAADPSDETPDPDAGLANDPVSIVEAGSPIVPTTSSADDLAKQVDDALNAGDMEAAETLIREGLQDESASNSNLLALQINLARVALARNQLAEARRILEAVLRDLEQLGQTGGSDWYQAATLLSASYKLQGEFVLARELDDERVRVCTESMSPEDPRRSEAEADFEAMCFATGDQTPSGQTAGGQSGGPTADGQPDGGGQAIGKSGDSRSRTRLKEHPDPEDPQGEMDLGFLSSGPGDEPKNKPSQDDGPSRSPGKYENEGDGEDSEDDFAARIAALLANQPGQVGKRIGERESKARSEEKQGHMDEAAELRQVNLDESIEAYPEADPRVQAARQALAHTEAARGNSRAARDQQSKACEQLASTLPPDHVALIEARLFLSELLEEAGETEAALLVLEQVLSNEIAVAIDEARLVELVGKIDELYRQCRMDDALALRRQVVELGQRILPLGSHAQAESRRELAALLRVTGRRAEARALEIEIRENGGTDLALEDRRTQAMEASYREERYATYPPELELSVSMDAGAIVVSAHVRSVAGVTRLSLVQDGKLQEIELLAPHWTPDPDGLGGRIALSLEAPADRFVSIFSMMAEDALAGRTVQTTALQINAGPP